MCFIVVSSLRNVFFVVKIVVEAADADEREKQVTVRFFPGHYTIPGATATAASSTVRSTATNIC